MEKEITQKDTKHLMSGAGEDTEHLMSGAGEDTEHLMSVAGEDTEHLMRGAGEDTEHLMSGAVEDTEHLMSGAGEDESRAAQSDKSVGKESAADRLDPATSEVDDVSKTKISNDMADYILVKCNICGAHKTMTSLRAHTKSAHKVSITEYKARYGAQLVPVKMTVHRCGICGDLVRLDSDHIAAHLKTPGHSMSHKNYNAAFMRDSRDSCMHKNLQQGKEERVIKKEIIKRENVEQEHGKKDSKSLFEMENLDFLNNIKEECDQLEDTKPEVRARRVKKKMTTLFDYDEDAAYQKAMKESLKELQPKINPLLKDPSANEKLGLKCLVTAKKMKFSEVQLESGVVTAGDKMDVGNFDDESIKPEPLFTSSSKPESEEVEKNIRRYQLGEGKVVKECNICKYSTDRYGMILLHL